MKEIANLTDFLLWLECAVLAFLLFKNPLKKYWVFLFGSLSVASFAGGITHTFFDEPGTFAHLFWWDVTLLCIGITATCCFMLAVQTWKLPCLPAVMNSGKALGANNEAPKDSHSPTGSRINTSSTKSVQCLRCALAVLFVYTLFILSGQRPFLSAIVLYLPASIYLFIAMVRRLRKTKEPCAPIGILGMALTFVAAGVQQSKLSLPELSLNYNAIYHLIQAVGLFLMFLYARKTVSEDF